MASYFARLFILAGVIHCFSSICSAQDCDSEGIATSIQQTLQSPSYPAFYAQNVHCVTHITSSDPNRVIELQFEDFDLQDSDDCEKDALVVYDGVDGGQRLMQHSCGTRWAWPHYPDIVRTTGPEVTLVFITDGEDGDGHRGYRLSYRTVEANPSLFFIAAPDERRIHAIRRDSAVNFAIVPQGLEYPQAVDYDPLDNWLYYSDKEAHNIGRYDVLLQWTEILHTREITDPFGLRVDIVNRLLYWTDVSERTISVSNLDGTQRKTLVAPRRGPQDLQKPGAIVTEPDQGYIYFTDWGDDAKIEKASGDGSGRVVLVEDRISTPHGLAIDLAGPERRLYWVDALLDTLESVDSFGRDRIELGKFPERDFFSLALDAGGFFITDEEFGWIELLDRVNIASNNLRVYIGNIREPRGITLRPENLDMGDIPQYTCPRTDCLGLCLPKPNNQFVCQIVLPQIYQPCPSDVQLILPMNTTSWREPAAYAPQPGLMLTTTRTHSSGQDFPVGIHRVIYTFEDNIGNTASCNFTVTVTEQFSLACPRDIFTFTPRGETEVVVTWTPPVDHQGRPVTTTNHNPGDSFPVGETTVEYSTIVNGMVERCSFTVTVRAADHKGPRFINCPDNIVRYIPAGHTSTTITWAPLKLDNPDDTIVFQPGDSVYVRQMDLAPTEFYVNVNETVTIKAEDPEGNAGWCNFTVFVTVDNILPIIRGCPGDIEREAPSEDAEVMISWREPVVWDNSGNVSLEVSHAPGSSFPVGQKIVVYHATDPSGNAQVCAFLVRIEGPGDRPNDAGARNDDGPVDADEILYISIFGAIVLLLLLIIIIILVIIAYRCKRKKARIPSIYDDNHNPPDYHFAVGSGGVDERQAAVAISGENIRFQAETNRAFDTSEEHPYDLAAVGLPPSYEEEVKKVPLAEGGDVAEKSVPPGFNAWNE